MHSSCVPASGTGTLRGSLPNSERTNAELRRIFLSKVRKTNLRSSLFSVSPLLLPAQGSRDVLPLPASALGDGPLGFGANSGPKYI